MSVCRKLPDGTVQKIAGHTILLDANAAEIRQGTGHLTMRTGQQYLDSTVTFSDPMPDTDYAVDISFVTGWGISALGRVQEKTVTGFRLEGYVANSSDATAYGADGWDFKYIAWKPVKIDGYTELQNKVNNPDETPTIDSMNLVTSDGVARAIKNASAVWKGTKAEWNALPAAEKQTYDLAVLLDKTLVKAVDREDGTETDVANLNKIWRGTKAEWEALSATEKAKYDQAEVIDEYTGVPVVVDKVESGNLNPVTSNAVAEALGNVGAFIHCGLPGYNLNNESATVMSTVNVPKGTWLLVGVVMNTVTTEQIKLAVTGDGASLTTGIVRSITEGDQSQTIIGVAKFTSDTNKVGIRFLSATGFCNGDGNYWYVNAIKIAE